MSLTTWSAPFDPNEVKDYSVDWSAEMAASADTIASASFAVPAAWTTAGLVLDDVTWDTTHATVWVSVTDPTTQAAGLVGAQVPVTCTVTTAGGRTLQRTVMLVIEER